MRLIQVVPTPPPRVCGVGDYAFRLARALQTSGIDSAFLAPYGCEKGQQTLDGFTVGAIPQRRAKVLEEALSSSAAEVALLHYTSHGYLRRGAPIWLAQGLRRWKAAAPRRRLVVMFHEVWSFGPPWSSSFWLLPLKQGAVAVILRLTEAFLTNNDLYAARLRRLALDRSPAAVLPVFSNIGETATPPAFDARDPIAVVFGQRHARERVYNHIADFLPVLCSAQIERILDIGPPLDDRAVARCPLPVKRCGYLEPASVSGILTRARFGLLDYRLDFAAKSGILAAYSAHALVPVIRSTAGGAADGLRHGVNLVHTSEPLPKLREAAQLLATAAHLWYRGHALERAAACFARTLRSVGTAKHQ